jgi:hypothetical protein
MPASKEKRFENLSFLEAIHHLKNNRKVRRANWPTNLYFWNDNGTIRNEGNATAAFLIPDFDAQNWIAFTSPETKD